MDCVWALADAQLKWSEQGMSKLVDMWDELLGHSACEGRRVENVMTTLWLINKAPEGSGVEFNGG